MSVVLVQSGATLTFPATQLAVVASALGMMAS